MGKVCHRWGLCDIRFKNSNWKWSDCQLVGEIVNFLQAPGVDAFSLVPPWQKTVEKKKHLIRLIATVKGEKYDETKEVVENVKITANDIKLVVKTVLGIDVDVSKIK